MHFLNGFSSRLVHCFFKYIKTIQIPLHTKVSTNYPAKREKDLLKLSLSICNLGSVEKSWSTGQMVQFVNKPNNSRDGYLKMWKGGRKRRQEEKSGFLWSGTKNEMGSI